SVTRCGSVARRALQTAQLMGDDWECQLWSVVAVLLERSDPPASLAFEPQFELFWGADAFRVRFSFSFSFVTLFPPTFVAEDEREYSIYLLYRGISSSACSVFLFELFLIANARETAIFIRQAS